MTDIFSMFPNQMFDTNNNPAASSGASQFQSATSRAMSDKAMLQLNAYPASVDYNQNMYAFPDESANCFYNNNGQYRMQTEEHSPHKPETIHSGHFMVSEIDDAENEPNAEEEAAKEDKEELIKADQQQVVEIKSIEQSSLQLLSLRPGRKSWDSKWNIDYPKSNQSLDSLFKKMNLGLDSKLISPKWKQFKGMKISLKNKIRVNNLIWRAWHIKYVLGRTPPFNPFPSQLDKAQLDMSHIYVVHRPEVMKIGKFFGGKRESCDDFIALEYIKWRRYYKEIIQKQNNQYNNSTNQWSNVDAFGYPYDNSNDQFNNMEMFHPMNNYSSAQLGIGAEFMQPELTYGIHPEFMDISFEEQCLPSFLSQKSSFLPTVVEEDSIQESTKIQEMPPQQSIYPSIESSMTADLSYDQQQQMQPVVGRQIGNQMSSQLNNSQLQQQTAAVSQQIQPTSPANYSYMGYHSQPQPIMQSQSNQISSMSYRQNAYMPNNNGNLMLDQQNASLNLTANLNGQQQPLSTLSPQGTPHQTMLAIENPLNSLNANLNGNVQVTGGQFAVPSKPAKQKTRSRSVSSLPKQQQAQLQRHHLIENSSSMMEINQPVMTNQSSFHNTTSNLVSSQQQQATVLQNQTNLSGLEQQQQQIRKNNGYMRCNELNQQTAMMNGQVMQQQQQPHLPNLNNQLQPATNSSASYYTMNLNEVSSMSAVSNMSNSIGSTQGAQQTGSPLSIEYVDRSMRNSSSSSASYYSGVQQMNTNSNANQPALQPSASSYSLSKYQSSNDTGTNLISQLLSTNNPKLAASNLSGNGLNSQQTSANTPYKRNSTGTYPNFSQQYGQLHDQFGSASVSNGSSISSLTMSSASVNTNSNSNQSSLTSSVNTNDPTSYHRGNQLLRKSNPHIQPNRPFAFNSSSSNAGLNSGMRNAASIGNQLICAQTTDSKHGASNLTSSMENLNKSCSISTKSHRIKREHHRKLSNSKLRTSPSGLSRSNSSKSVNHSPVSPTTSLQATLMSQQQQQANKMSAGHSFSFFDRNLPLNGNALAANGNLAVGSSNSINSNLQSSLSAVLNSNLSPNLSSGLGSNIIASNLNSANSSSLSSTPTLQSPLTNSSFGSRNEYPADSLPLYNPSALAFLDQSLSLNGNGQLTKSAATFKSSHSSNNSSTNSNNLASPSGLIKNERDPNQYKEHRRVCHINAEQKRRCNIKHGFDTLRAILPSISANNNTKISKASMLQKGAEHIRHLRIEQETQNAEIQQLRSQIESLNQTIGIFQNQLPASGAPVSGMRPGQIKERFDDYVREKTQSHWKFWMFSIIMEPLLDSYNNTIPATNFDELSSSVLRWLDQNCNLVNLRKEVLNSLRVISTSTNVLTSPALLAEESLSKVQKKAHKKK